MITPPPDPAELKPIRELYDAGHFPEVMTLKHVLNLCGKGEIRTATLAGRHCSTAEWIREYLVKRIVPPRETAESQYESEHLERGIDVQRDSEPPTAGTSQKVPGTSEKDAA
jgi:hypothetical protein